MNILVQDFKEEIENRKKPINTVSLQLESLKEFAKGLGYKPVNGDPGRGFVNNSITKWKFVSWRTMIHWHNNPTNTYGPHCPMGGTQLYQAIDNKLVERVKLQRTSNKFIPHNYYDSCLNVKLVDNRYKLLSKLTMITGETNHQKLDKIIELVINGGIDG